jgi:pyridoxine 5-phosphate synthase
MTPKLGVNIDHVATLRQARGTIYPSVTGAAQLAIEGGAHGITVHLREDRRHIQLRDVEDLKEVLTVPLNLEMAATVEMRDIARRIRPQEVCLVPEKRQELTTEGGLDVAKQVDYLRGFCDALKEQEIKVSLFIDPTQIQIDASRSVGADLIELHTGRYADLDAGPAQDGALSELRAATRYAEQAGLVVNAGHGLNYENVRPVADIEHINCLNIGHAIVAHAIEVGLAQAVADMLRAMEGSRLDQ